MQCLFTAIIGKTIKLWNRLIFHCTILGYIFPLYSTLLTSKWPLYFSFFFPSSRWSVVDMFRFFVLPVKSAGTTRPTSHFCLPVTTALDLFSLSAFKKLSTKVQHSILTSNVLMAISLFAFFRLPHRFSLWKNLFYRTQKTLQVKFVAFSLPLFI